MDTITEWTPLSSEEKWSQFFEGLVPTCEDDSLIDFDKICVVAVHYYEHWGTLYFLYYTDLSSASKDSDNTIQSLKPILQFDCLYAGLVYTDYVVVGSRLFLVGGLDDESNWVSTLHYYDFGSRMNSGTTTIIKEEDLEAGPPMKDRKLAPIVAVVGGTKICVFSTLLYKSDHFERAERDFPANFEVYDTVDRSWTKLRELVDDYSTFKLDQIGIRSYCVERSCIIICTEIGIYGINIGETARDPRWVKMERSERIELGPSIGKWVVVGKNFCSPFEVAGWGEVQSRPFALENEGSLILDHRVGALCSERVGDGVVLCSVRGAVMPVTGEARYPDMTSVPALMVNVVKFDSKLLENLRGEKWKTIQSDKSVDFVIESLDCYDIELLGCYFPFKVT